MAFVNREEQRFRQSKMTVVRFWLGARKFASWKSSFTSGRLIACGQCASRRPLGSRSNRVSRFISNVGRSLCRLLKACFFQLRRFSRVWSGLHKTKNASIEYRVFRASLAQSQRPTDIVFGKSGKKTFRGAFWSLREIERFIFFANYINFIFGAENEVASDDN